MSALRLGTVSMLPLTLGAVLLMTQAALFAASVSTSPDTAAHTVSGEVMKISSEFYIVKDATGKTTLLQLQKYTVLDDGIKDGDRVQAQLADDGRTLSIKKVGGPSGARNQRSTPLSPPP